MSRTRLARAGVLGALLTACGAAPARAPASPEEKQLTAPGAYPAPDSKALPEGEKGVAQPGLDQPESASPALAQVDEVEAAFERSATELKTALATERDCEVARKALASMERSADRICELNGPDDPGKRCAYARERVQTARDKVSRSCGS